MSGRDQALRRAGRPAGGRPEGRGRAAARVRGRGRTLVLGLLLASLLTAAEAGAQAPPALPFAVGEELVYRVRVARLGTIGRGTMRVDGPEQVRGTETYVLRFDFRSRVGLIVVEDRTRSWFDPRRMASLRYQKHERGPFSTSREDVEMFPGERRWVAADGDHGDSPTDRPLDELSFLYHVRTLPLADGDSYACDLHFDADRNPVRIRVIGRERTTVSAGEFATVTVEMRVKDGRRYGGEGVIRLHLTDDARRIPVRIQSSMPGFGTTMLDLDALPEVRVAAKEREPAIEQRTGSAPRGILGRP